MHLIEVITRAYGILMLLTLCATLPNFRRFFSSETHGGYLMAGTWIDRLTSPPANTLLGLVWFGCNGCLLGYRWVLPAAFVNLLICHVLFIRFRWNSLLRGMGAPGFISHWLGALVFLLEFSHHLDGSGKLREQILFVFQVDFAFIMLAAGFYKLISGYAQHMGMDIGAANPIWGRYWKIFMKIPPANPYYHFQNIMAISGELAAGVLMLIPSTRALGGAIIAGSFIYVMMLIRLGFLCEMVILCTFTHMGPYFFEHLGPVVAAQPAHPWLSTWLSSALWAYLVLLPFGYAFLYTNFLGKKRLPAMLQKTGEFYTNFFGMILWRVFTIDLVNFFPRIHRQGPDGTRRTYDPPTRFWHVGESITLATLFTALKYYPDNVELFKGRLLRYAKTVPRKPEEQVVFEYISIQKVRLYEHRAVAEFLVDPDRGSVDEITLDPQFSLRAVARNSPTLRTAGPGTYAPPPEQDSPNGGAARRR